MKFPEQTVFTKPDSRVMQIAPHKKDDWMALALLPAKVFLVTFILLAAGGFTFLGVTPVYWWCIVLSGPLLLLGALVQGIFCQQGYASRTISFLGFLTLSVGMGSWLGVDGIYIPFVCWLFWRIARRIRLPKPASAEPNEPIECLECHATIPVGDSRCPHCGWTFKI